MSASAPREFARRAVSRIRERKAFAHETVDSMLPKADLDPRDAAFATRLVYGTVQTRGTLDEAVRRCLTGSTKLEPKLSDALAVSAYEILFARTPARAAVSEGVELARSVQPRASGLANAVLRKLAAEAPEFPWGDPSTDTTALARQFGHPMWLAELLVAELGPDAARMMAADNEPAPLYLAHNPFAGTLEDAIAALEEAGAAPTPCIPEGCVVAGDASRAVRSRAIADGLVVVTDAAAQLVPRLLRSSAGQAIADIGSGRGTKTLLLQADAVRRSGEPAHFLAVDVHGFKTEMLARRMAELGVPNVTALTGDATDLGAIPGIPGPQTLDAVLVDAPCSGLGTLRRHPEQRWRLEQGLIDALAALGLRLLEAAASLVRPGGFVVYSTCTVTRRENMDVVHAFLEGTEGFRLDDVSADVPAAWQRFVTGEGAFQSVPEPDGPDGHFAARLIRE